MEQNKDQLLGDLYALRAGLSMISEEADNIEKVEACATADYNKIAESSSIKPYLRFEFAEKAGDGYDNLYPKEELQIWLDGDNFTANCNKDLREEISVSEWIRKNYRRYFNGDGYVSQSDAEQILRKDDDYKQLSRLTFENCKLFAEQGSAVAPYPKNYQIDSKQANRVYAQWLATEEADRDLRRSLDRVEKTQRSKEKHIMEIVVSLFLAALIALNVFFIIKGIDFSFLFFTPTVLAIVAGVLLVLWIIWCVRQAIKSKKKKSNRREELSSAYRKQINDLPEIRKQVGAVAKKRTHELERIKSFGDTVTGELQRTYGAILDPRDWKYVDLVIFYFETGRADTMKEALVLVEREVQTQRIEGAIKMAADRVCSAISHATAIISSQLNTISSQLSTVIAQQQIQIGQNQRLIAAADMQNALLKKANTTSEQLMNDVSYIKNYGTGALRH